MLNKKKVWCYFYIYKQLILLMHWWAFGSSAHGWYNHFNSTSTPYYRRGCCLFDI